MSAKSYWRAVIALPGALSVTCAALGSVELLVLGLAYLAMAGAGLLLVRRRDSEAHRRLSLAVPLLAIPLSVVYSRYTNLGVPEHRQVELVLHLVPAVFLVPCGYLYVGPLARGVLLGALGRGPPAGRAAHRAPGVS